MIIRSPLVSIILPCRNERDYIVNCLASILRQEAPAGGFELIVADGGSDDGTLEIVQSLAKKEQCIRLVENPACIVSTGMNAAIRVAKGQIIVRMDAHTEYASDYVRQCVEVLHETNADNVGGPWVAEGNGLVGRAIATAFQSPFAVGSACGHNPDFEGIVDTVYLGCWPRHIFDRIGLFDEELVRNQDDEFNLRLSRLGGKIWQSPRIKSRYNTRSSLLALFRQYLQYGYWKVRVIQKHGLPASVRHLVPAGFVLSLIVLTPAYFWWPLAAKTWLLLVGIYSLCVFIASFLTASASEWKLLPFLPLVFVCYHFGYGYGFLRGVVDFIILQRGPNPAYTKLSRVTEDHLLRQTEVRVRNRRPVCGTGDAMNNLSSELSDNSRMNGVCSDYERAEEERIRAAYASRQEDDARYSWVSPGHLYMVQERERRILKLLRQNGFAPLGTKKILEIGCGTGNWLRDLIKWGARPENITGLDLLPDRVVEARNLCPEAVRVECGHAAELAFPGEAFDLVLQSTVFTSILDPSMKRQVASEMLRVLKGNGIILWYDFHVNNPWNADVRGMKMREIHQLFPGCRIKLQRITLAPPLVRLLAPHSWLACYLLGKIPWLCTHYVGVIWKG